MGAFLGMFVGDKRVDFALGRDDSEGVECHSAQEGEVVCKGREGGGKGAELGPDGAFVDPLFEKLDFVRGETVAFWRHLFVFVSGEDAFEQRALRGFAWDDGWAVRFAAFERGVTGI